MTQSEYERGRDAGIIYGEKAEMQRIIKILRNDNCKCDQLCNCAVEKERLIKKITGASK
jgi:hypothetical protein